MTKVSHNDGCPRCGGISNCCLAFGSLHWVNELARGDCGALTEASGNSVLSLPHTTPPEQHVPIA